MEALEGLEAQEDLWVREVTQCLPAIPLTTILGEAVAWVARWEGQWDPEVK